ncbi:MAG: A/G-specific adenine glycosylase [Verrucomicrobia bacterium]|nr:MAG: A/G-specific adenine glycosylase [Verrucomicrobiota bacterium]
MIENREAFRDALLEWFAKSGKDYPWRRTRDGYAVLVSEVMLQQTQIATVLGKSYYTRFLASFPDVTALAAAADESLLKAWEGLGYYRRARMLRATARAVIANHAGQFPRETAELLDLPGIGPYTAGALRAFAFDLPGAVVDGNVTRVLARLMNFSGPVDTTAGQRQMAQWADALEDKQQPRAYNSALMELGQTLCRPGEPACAACPVAKFCRAQAPARLPVKQRKIPSSAVDEHALWLRDATGRLLLHCEDGQRRTGLWKLPTRAAAEIAHLPVVAEQRYAITRYRVRLRVHAGGNGSFPLVPGEAWQGQDCVARLPMPSPFRKVLTRLLEESSDRM